ncbi:hypothetical protein RF11_01327 [Thelohanellus kitauei]|uniref:Integrase p58-like C-terminal domain-containing protein n=1 Tax=Thelohanellus kitauei TaxID=669202 RepID=A0A0C2N7X2_THEKT|nr:hypothetical protein RF11_01327 [Thelohanellus kitauei]
MLRLSARDNQMNSWDDDIPLVLFAYRQSIQSSTKYSPYELMFGRKPTLINDFLDDNNPAISTRSSYILNMKKKLSRIYTFVKNSQEKASLRQKHYYDRNKIMAEYNVGKQILLKCSPKPNINKKFLQVWEGPYTIIEKISPCLYKVADNNNSLNVKVVHIDRRKPLIERKTSGDPNKIYHRFNYDYNENLTVPETKPEQQANEDIPSKRTRKPQDRFGDTISYVFSESSDLSGEECNDPDWVPPRGRSAGGGQ